VSNVAQQRGVAALMTVIIVAAATLIIAMNASLLGLGDLEEGYTSQRGGEVFSLTDGCVEETLRHMRLDSNYGIGEGDINLSVVNGSCIINVTDLGSNQRQVVVIGTSGDYNKKIETVVTLSGDATSGVIITLNSWEEKDD